MSVPVLTFFNNKGGVGKTSLVYHIAQMMAALGVKPLVVDLDPQCNLTASFLSDEKVESLWDDPAQKDPRTVYEAIQPLLEGTGDVEDPDLHPLETVSLPHEEAEQELPVSSKTTIRVYDGIHMIAGDLRLSSFEDELSQSWTGCLGGNARAFRVQSAFWRVMMKGAEACGADIVIADIGPNLGSINRATLVASDHIITPLAPDLYSLQGLRNLGPTLRRWRKDWLQRVQLNPSPESLALPPGRMQPMGYVVMQHSVARQSQATKHYEKWIRRIPVDYRDYVLCEPNLREEQVEEENCLGLLKHYRSLMPMAQEAGKPVFLLKPADGAIGSHQQGVQGAYADFRALTRTIQDALSI